MSEVVQGGALWLAIPIAMLAGLISFASPCVLPLVPGYLGFLGGAATGASRRPVGMSPRGRLVLGVALFILGFTVVFVAMGVLAGTAGRFFLQYGDLLTRILGAVVIVMGLVFLGVFGFAQRTAKPQIRQGLGLAGAPLLGIAMGIGWAPCIGPTYTAILSISFAQADPARAVVLAVAYSLGLGIPFILLAIGFGWATRSVAFLRRHIRVVNIVGGVLLIVLGVLMVTGVWTSVMSQLTGVIGSVVLPL